MAKIEIYSAYNRPPKVRLECKDPSLARQSEKAAADINNIVSRYYKTGMLPQVSLPGLYLDVSQVSDYREALERVQFADKVFMSLPAEVRAKFENDPAVFLDFTANPDNRIELQRMGLLAPDGSGDKDATGPEPPLNPA